MSTNKTIYIDHRGSTYRVSCLKHKIWFRDSFERLDEISGDYIEVRTIDVPDSVIIHVTKKLRALNNLPLLNPKQLIQ